MSAVERQKILLRAALVVAWLVLTTAPASATVILGNNGVGAALDTGDSDSLNGSRVTVGTTNVVVSSMSVYVGSIDTTPHNHYGVAIYTDSSGAPGTLVVASATGTLAGNAWNTRAISATLQANTSYWLMYNTDGSGNSLNNMYYSVASLGRGAFSSSAVTFGSWPNNFPATLTVGNYSLYATAESSIDPTPPTVAITAPGQGATVSGTVTVATTASDNVGVAGVQLRVDGIDSGAEVTSPPYSIEWDTATTANGPHTLTAIARDGAGNLTTSAPVTVAVSNADLRSTTGEWSPVLSWPLIAIHANLLKTGKVLVWDEQSAVTQPMLWDPATLNLSNTPLVDAEIFCAGHTQLADGQVLVAGGHQAQYGEVGTRNTYQYVPDTDTWIRTGDVQYARWYPALTKLSDGRVVIFSGQIIEDAYADTPELYDPADGSVTPLNTIATPELHEEEFPANFHLPSGKLLAISPEHGPVQLFDAGAMTWTHVNTTPITLGSAVQYRPGKILMAGGGSTFLASAQGNAAVLDTNVPTPVWQATGSMSFGRYMHNLVMLPTGDVLAVGGSSIADQQTASATLPTESWSPDTGTWTTLASITDPRMYHSTALLLPDGRVLSAGGGHNGAAPTYYSAQVYSPPYLFQGLRPSIASAPDVLVYGPNTFVVASPDASNISTVSLIALGSATHATNMNDVYTELSFTESAGQLVVSPPADSDQVPPGYYMLFIVNSDRVPSVAKIVRVTGDATVESASGPITAGGTMSTDNEGPGGTADGATIDDPVETTLTSPNAGSASITEAAATGPPAPGFGLSDVIAQEVSISAPPATAGNPLILVFRIDASRIPIGLDQNDIEVFKDALPVSECAAATGSADPDPCVSNRVLQGDGDVEITVLTSTASVWRFVFRCGAAVERPRLVLRKLDTPPGDDRLRLQGSVTLPHPFNPPLDPGATGVRLLVYGAGHNVVDVAIPGGAYVNPPGIGWRATGSQWTYKNNSATPPGGIAKMTIRDNSAGTPGLLKIRATGRAGAYPVAPADLPLAWRLVLSPPVEGCGKASFPGPAPAPKCQFNNGNSTLTCR